MTLTTNDTRAERFDRILAAYDTGDTPAERLTDLLADARHWCDHNGLCFGDVDRIAHGHYLAELEGGRS